MMEYANLGTVVDFNDLIFEIQTKVGALPLRRWGSMSFFRWILVNTKEDLSIEFWQLSIESGFQILMFKICYILQTLRFIFFC